MTKTQVEEHPVEATQPSELSKAIDLVRAAIHAEEKRFQAIANGTEQDPIMLEGSTSLGYQVRMILDPSKVARVMLDYEYPMYSVLGEDAPQGMWDELARMVGLHDVYCVDI